MFNNPHQRYLFHKAALVTLLCMPLLAQHANHFPLTVVVDGAKDPSLIPDEVAYRHFLLSIAEHTAPSPLELHRREGRLKAFDLRPTDRALLLQQVGGIREQIEEMAASHLSIMNSSGTAAEKESALKDLLLRQHTLLDVTATSLRSRLSVDGRRRLDTYLNTHVKAHIVLLSNAK